LRPIGGRHRCKWTPRAGFTLPTGLSHLSAASLPTDPPTQRQPPGCQPPRALHARTLSSVWARHPHIAVPRHTLPPATSASHAAPNESGFHRSMHASSHLPPQEALCSALPCLARTPISTCRPGRRFDLPCRPSVSLCGVSAMDGTKVAPVRRGCVRLLQVTGGAGTGGSPNQQLIQGGHVEARTRPHTPPPPRRNPL